MGQLRLIPQRELMLELGGGRQYHPRFVRYRESHRG